jgi:hypothetical protein
MDLHRFTRIVYFISRGTALHFAHSLAVHQQIEYGGRAYYKSVCSSMEKPVDLIEALEEAALKYIVPIRIMVRTGVTS